MASRDELPLRVSLRELLPRSYWKDHSGCRRRSAATANVHLKLFDPNGVEKTLLNAASHPEFQ